MADNVLKELGDIKAVLGELKGECGARFDAIDTRLDRQHKSLWETGGMAHRLTKAETQIKVQEARLIKTPAIISTTVTVVLTVLWYIGTYVAQRLGGN